MLPLEIQKEINDFFEDIKVYGYNYEFTELSDLRSKENYDNIIKNLSDITLPNPTALKFSTMSLEELVSILGEILIKIFGSNYKERIETYNSLLKLVPIENPFEAMVESIIVNGEQVPKHVYISDQCKSIQIVSTGHEYIHCMLSKYDSNGFNDRINNVHYKELLSILIEYIICYELSKILRDEKLQEKHELIRIHHDKDQALERIECLSLIPQLVKLHPLDAMSLHSYIKYQEHNSFSYILSNIYALYLLDAYKEEPTKLMSMITAIIDKDQCIRDLLEYFNLSLENQDVIKKYNLVMKNVSKTLHL